MPRLDPTQLSAEPAAHVRGSATYHALATLELRLGSALVDGALAITLFFLLHRALRLSPMPDPWWVAVVIFLTGMSWGVQRAWIGRTLGDLAWSLKAARPGLMEPLLKPTRHSAQEIALGALLTVGALGICGWSIDQAVFKQPIWARAETLELDASLPDMSSGQWEVLPFFFSLGAWPRSYAGKPVFYSLPYEKGPPDRFVGHLTARWDDPLTRVTFEGPKTPQAPVAALPGERTPRERIRECLLGESRSWGCMKIREATMMRHLTDMQERLSGKSGGNVALKMKWQVRWFQVKNSALAPSERLQGVYLSAEDEGRGEERYVLITENGTHQAVWLDYPRPGSMDAQTARDTFSQAIRSLRASDALNSGRAWIDRKLETVRLGELLRGASLQPKADPASVEQLASVQAMLLAKITVQPSIFESYFHLGGTALLLNRIARIGQQEGKLQGLEISAVSRPMIQSAYRYAQDVAPNDPRTTQLQGFWLEAQKR